MTNDEQNFGIVSWRETLLQGFFTSLTLASGQTAIVGTLGNLGISLWQQNQMAKVIKEFEKKFYNIDRNKLDREALESDEFKSLILQAVEIGAETASDLKREALAKAMSNSIVLPTSKLSNKQILIRVLSQLADQEMIALKFFYEKEEAIVDYENSRTHGQARGCVTEADLVKEYDWTEEDCSVVCEGLAQLGLISSSGGNLGDKRGKWRITTLAKNLIYWVL